MANAVVNEVKEKRMTLREQYEDLLTIPEVANNEKRVAFIAGRIEQLAKKNTSERKPTKQQEANEGVKATILEVLANSEKPMTITDIQKASPEFAEMSNQRISALIRQLREEEKVKRTEVKRKAYFEVA